MITTRRAFFGLLAAPLAAPAIIRVADLMPIKALMPAPEPWAYAFDQYGLIGFDPKMWPAKGRWGEQVYFGRKLSHKEMRDMEIGLARKYGITALLPAVEVDICDIYNQALEA